ncbi:serine hydrolase [Pseudemcibacter aquimaris]|uniref:serine hydrolase n=1 Tax=Pseudemcibacter aquimaris TaxID=2857064 RepID=UPI00201160B2|nr:serine hydrolase [Pseudemcibacter aquimaris]MCC3859923.1 serine hydrolase [Pseudemcibacter aquimaris]WDU57255.1 serine hydrolase [Pseudemcibacter aquimaris]
MASTTKRRSKYQIKLSAFLFTILCALLIPNIVRAGQAEASMQAQMTEQKLKTYLNGLEKKRFSGSVLVEYDGEKILSQGYGLSNREQKINYTPDTISDMGSITKHFTAAAILKLEMQGKLSTTDTLSKYFSTVPDDKKNINLHQLLTHSAGLALYSGDDFEAVTEEEFINIAFNEKLLFKPGSTFEYSNVGYSLLAIIIEQVSGTSYENYLAENIFKPAGMLNTGYTKPDFDPQNMAVGYRGNEIWGKPNEMGWDKDAPYWHLKGNGGLLSTAEDMYKWHKALNEEAILSKKAKAKFYHPHVFAEGENSPIHYAYGWFIEQTPLGGQLINHNGGNGIIFADFHRYIEKGVTIIIFSNNYDQYALKMAKQLAGIIFDPSFQPDEKHGYKFLSELLETDWSIERIIDFIKSEKSLNVPSDFIIDERSINRLGYRLIRQDKTDEALKVFELNTQLHPNSANVFDSYGETLIKMNRIQEGLIAYKKALEIDPNYPFADDARIIIKQYSNK